MYPPTGQTVKEGIFYGYLRFGWNLRLDRRLNHPIFSWAIPASMPFFSPKLCEKTRFDGGILDKYGIKGDNSDAFRRFSVKISHQIALLNDFLWVMAHNFTSENKILQQNQSRKGVNV